MATEYSRSDAVPAPRLPGAAAVGAIAYGHLAAYRARKACADSGACARPVPRRLVDAGLWTGTVMVAIAIAANFAAPMS